MKKINKKAIFSISASLISILIGLILGLILLFIFDSDRAMVGFEALVGTGVSTPEKFAKVLYQATPLILAGLSVAFAFKTGLFNIGAPGQYTIGAFCALFAAIVLGTPWYVSLIFAMIGGAIWGILPGLFKAHFNVNEVITCIMLNWIGLFLVNLLVSNIPQMLQNYWAGSITNRTVNLALVEKFYGVQTTIPKAGLDTLLGGSSYMNISIFIAIGIAIITYIILNKTTFGYELKACGFNKNASTYAGINAKRNIVLSMIIAGGIAGIAGGIYFLSGTAEYVIEKNLMSMGFNGIPVALLASSNPLGVIFSSLFISYIQVGGEALQRYQFSSEIINIIISAIIYLSAFAFLIKLFIEKIFSKKEREETKTEEIKGEVQSK
jgi:simple sugar transport system permease protein